MLKAKLVFWPIASSMERQKKEPHRHSALKPMRDSPIERVNPIFTQLKLWWNPSTNKKPPLTEATRASEGKPIRVGSWWKALPANHLTTFKNITAIFGCVA